MVDQDGGYPSGPNGERAKARPRWPAREGALAEREQSGFEKTPPNTPRNGLATRRKMISPITRGKMISLASRAKSVAEHPLRGDEDRSPHRRRQE